MQNWEHTKPENRHQITIKRGGKPRSDIKPERITDIVEQVGQWRKANAIHAWFVKNVQKDVDDCGYYRVSREKLIELKAACDKVIAASKLKPGKVTNGYTFTASGKRKPIVEDGNVLVDAQIAETVLPTQGGFFFGNTDYNEWYLEDIKQTSELIASLLAEPEDGDFYYHSSW